VFPGKAVVSVPAWRWMESGIVPFLRSPSTPVSRWWVHRALDDQNAHG